MTDSILQIILISIFVSIIVFLIAREFWCWYFKFNASLEESKEQTFLLKMLLEEAKKTNEIILEGFDLEEEEETNKTD